MAGIRGIPESMACRIFVFLFYHHTLLYHTIIDYTIIYHTILLYHVRLLCFLCGLLGPSLDKSLDRSLPRKELAVGAELELRQQSAGSWLQPAFSFPFKRSDLKGRHICICIYVYILFYMYLYRDIGK